MSQQNSLWRFADPYVYPYADLSKQQPNTVAPPSLISNDHGTASRLPQEVALHQPVTASSVPAAELQGSLCRFSAAQGTRYGMLCEAGVSEIYELEASTCLPQVEISISVPSTKVQQPAMATDPIPYCSEHRREGTSCCEKKSPVAEDAQITALRRQLAQMKKETKVLLRRSLLHNKGQSCFLEETSSLPQVVGLDSATVHSPRGRPESIGARFTDFESILENLDSIDDKRKYEKRPSRGDRLQDLYNSGTGLVL